jgi:hypothetical protein
MKIVLDACVPDPFRHEIIGHDVVTLHYLGLSRLEDAALLDAIEGKFDVMITCDRSIPWQNRFAGRTIAIAILCAQSNKLNELVRLIPSLQRELKHIKSGEVVEIGEG